MTNTSAVEPTNWHWRIIANLALASMMLVMLYGIASPESSWFLMAPDEKMVSSPSAAIRMEHGPVVGPLKFTSRGNFPSRAECEPARQKLVTQWRQLSVIKRGSWDKYGFNSPSVFVRCIPANDPQLKTPPAGAGASPTMETFVNRPNFRR
jgi:hypothetical protein